MVTYKIAIELKVQRENSIVFYGEYGSDNISFADRVCIRNRLD